MDAFLYSSRIDPTMITLILFSWMPYARLMNTQVRTAMQSEYVRAAQSIGATGPRIIRYHLLPNTIAPAIVLAARDVGGMVVLACAFIFIGFGGNVAWERCLLPAAISSSGCPGTRLSTGGRLCRYPWL
ncbi:MAG: ABC transporter permease subunit [Chloroflexota bacterium]